MRKEINKIILNGLKHSQRIEQLNVSDRLINELSEKLSDNIVRRLEIFDTTDRKVTESLIYSILSRCSNVDLSNSKNVEEISIKISGIFHGENSDS